MVGVAACAVVLAGAVYPALEPVAAAAQRAIPGPAPVFERLMGAWEGDGQLFGQPASFSMRWEWTLDRRFVELSFENRLIQPDGSGRTVLRARAFYTATEPLRGAWFDTRGEILELSAAATDSTLVAEWSAESETGRTTYRILEPDLLEVRDEVLGDDGLRVFGVASYRRAGTGGGQ